MTSFLTVVIQADPLHTLRPQSDSTLFIAAELCRRKHRVFFYTTKDLRIGTDGIYADGAFVEVQYSDFSSTYHIHTAHTIKLEDVDAVLIRQDPPFDMDYITSTYILDGLPSRIVVLNSPKGLRNNPEKLLPFAFPDLIPPTMVLSSYSEAASNFIEQYHQVVLKPLYGHGGNDVVLLGEEAEPLIQEYLQKHGHIILQEFLPEVKKGDKRIILLDGEPVAALHRLPIAGDIRTNLAAGAIAQATEITPSEKELCARLKPHLQAHGLIFAGVDIIAGRLIEINLTSPTGLIAVYRLYGVNLAEQLATRIEQAVSLKG